MIFSETENVLFDGMITSYSNTTFEATVDVYKDGINSQTVIANGTIDSKVQLTLQLTGTGYGNGDLTLDYEVAMNATPATHSRFIATALGWGGYTKTVSRDETMYMNADQADTNKFKGGATGDFACNYLDGIKKVPNAKRNIYALNFWSRETGNDTCDHEGVDFKGLVTIVDGGKYGVDGLMWFAASNGYFSNFSVLEDQ